MSHVTTILISPLVILSELILLSTVFFTIRKFKIFKILLIISGLWFIIISTGFIPELLVKNLERQYPNSFLPPKSFERVPVNVLILGGGLSDNVKLAPNDRLSTSSLCRLIEGIRIHNSIPNSKIIVTSYVESSTGNQADLMIKTATSVGLSISSFETIELVQSTRDEAMRFRSKFGSKGTLILVTDAIHMPRAMKIFHKYGFDPLPAATNHLIKDENKQLKRLLFPSSRNIYEMEIAMHEYLGILWFWFVDL